MLDTLQFLLSLQILGFCIFGGITLLLRARENRAKRILGWAMLLWGFLTIVRVSVNIYLREAKETFHPLILIVGCFVVASLACYVIEVLRPGYLTGKRIFVFISPILVLGVFNFVFWLSGGEMHIYYSVKDVFGQFNPDVIMRMLVFLLMLFYMSLPVYLVSRYRKEFKAYLSENVSDPEGYDLDWLKKTMIILLIMYVFYLILLLTDIPVLYVVDKVVLLVVWYYFFYKALFLKTFEPEHTFQGGWELPEPYEKEDNDQPLSNRYVEEVDAWFEREKPYLRDDLRLTDLQRVFPISRSYLSQLFNKDLGQSFSDYVNKYRIEESIRLLEAEPLTTIRDIAERSGFYSISTFRRAFQKYTGTVPSEYKREK